MMSRSGVLQPVDDAARALARRLIRGARFGALAVLEAGTGHPYASRVSVAPDIDGAPTILASSLSPHSAAIDADPRCTLLLGEPGRGDPLAHPRISVIGRAQRLASESDDDSRVRERFLARHPKAARYAGFDDFAFFRIEPERASLNGGFGRAYALSVEDMFGGIGAGLLTALATAERNAVSHMNGDHAEAVALYATRLCGAGAGTWRIVSIDPFGFDMMDAARIERIVRLEFDAPLCEAGELRQALVALAARARAAVVTGSRDY